MLFICIQGLKAVCMDNAVKLFCGTYILVSIDSNQREIVHLKFLL